MSMATLIKRSMKLTDKQRKFCEQHLVSFNATQAAISAGHSKKSAYSIGCENLRKPEIRKHMRRQIANRNLRTRVARARVLKELEKMADALAIMRLLEPMSQDQVGREFEKMVEAREAGNGEDDRIECYPIKAMKKALGEERIISEVEEKLKSLLSRGDRGF